MPKRRATNAEKARDARSERLRSAGTVKARGLDWVIDFGQFKGLRIRFVLDCVDPRQIEDHLMKGIYTLTPEAQQHYEAKLHELLSQMVILDDGDEEKNDLPF